MTRWRRRRRRGRKIIVVCVRQGRLRGTGASLSALTSLSLARARVLSRLLSLSLALSLSLLLSLPPTLSLLRKVNTHTTLAHSHTRTLAHTSHKHIIYLRIKIRARLIYMIFVCITYISHLCLVIDDLYAHRLEQGNLRQIDLFLYAGYSRRDSLVSECKVCVCVCVRVCVCVCVCMCVFPPEFLVVGMQGQRVLYLSLCLCVSLSLSRYIHIRIYIHACMHAYVRTHMHA